MKFEELTLESQQAAREVLADLLRAKYEQLLVLPDDTVKYLGHDVRKAFAALESEELKFGSGED
ncbi:hypothetical protein [Xenorhabdus szentirmaii]|uniref:hypothetical protein n=1 Tax=Xenorhabdus szentirmaii TaxID=290112 RepID=UPI0019C73225|nr:hypothetical protein [Xenorhabdus sp. 5]MBD2827027.1 hypothetical protein [Xenorhabdus sp. 5]